ncbi:PIN domain-containing protein [Paracoccus sp. (in: a-proteobacteria)]|uniref:PIN domain-containing protein n=1 Tax=Paracoccus sp. TaxID=267 RepID=UPI003A8BA50E
MTGLDTNVLVRYLTQDDPGQAALATAAVSALTEDAPGWIAREVMVETVWVLERAYHLPRGNIADAIDGLLAARELVIEEADRVGLAAQRWREGGAGFADQMIALAGQGAGCRETLTFDIKAARIDGMELLDAHGEG